MNTVKIIVYISQSESQNHQAATPNLQTLGDALRSKGKRQELASCYAR